MDSSTYEQIAISAKQLGEAIGFLKENTEVEVLFYNKKPINIELPLFLNLKIEKTDPGIKGNTVSGGSKPATLETGATVQVPLFINEGDVVRVNTENGEYIERVG